VTATVDKFLCRVTFPICRQALKQLSVSVPVMTQARPQPANDPLVTPAGPPSPEQQPGSSKSRQKKFHRHFKQVAAEEHVLNCEYHCPHFCSSSSLTFVCPRNNRRLQAHTVYEGESVNRSQIDIKRKTCDKQTWEKHLFLDISSTNIDTLIPSLLPVR
jgi:hypothetical protein